MATIVAAIIGLIGIIAGVFLTALLNKYGLDGTKNLIKEDFICPIKKHWKAAFIALIFVVLLTGAAVAIKSRTPIQETSEFHSNIGGRYLDLKQYEKASDEYQTAKDLAPDEAEYYDRQAIALGRLEKYEEALEGNLFAVELKPNVAQYHNNEGVTLALMGYSSEAILELEKAVDLDPSHAGYRNNLGIALVSAKRYEEALEVLRESVMLGQDDAKCHYSLGTALFGLEQYEDAKYEFQTAVELEQENAQYHNGLGVTLYFMRHYQEAVPELQTATELEPENYTYHYSFGRCLLALRRYDEARRELQKAEELNPSDSCYYYGLDAVLSAVGENDVDYTNGNGGFATATSESVDGQPANDLIDVGVSTAGLDDSTDYDDEPQVETDSPSSRVDEAACTDADTTNTERAGNTKSEKATVNAKDVYQTNDQINTPVTPTGHNDKTDYDSETNTASGYKAEISDPLYTEMDAPADNMEETARADTDTADQFENMDYGMDTFNTEDGCQTNDPTDETDTVTNINDEKDCEETLVESKEAEQMFPTIVLNYYIGDLAGDPLDPHDVMITDFFNPRYTNDADDPDDPNDPFDPDDPNLLP